MFSFKKPSSKSPEFPDDEARFKAAAKSNVTMALSQRVPEEYLYDPLNAEPKLDHLRSVLIQQAEWNEKNDAHDYNNNMDIGSPSTTHGKRRALKNDTIITDILSAADKDVDEHLARIKAVLAQDPTLLDSYTRQNDISLHDRHERLDQMQQKRNKLKLQSMDVLKSLSQNIDGSTNDEDLTSQSDVQQARLEAWEKALEWYIYCPPEKNGADGIVTGGAGAGGSAATGTTSTTVASTTKTSSPSPSPAKSPSRIASKRGSLARRDEKPTLTLHQLLQHLSITSITEDDQTHTAALEKATQICTSHLETALSLITDASENTGLMYEAYAIHLMAHGLAAQGILTRCENIQNQYLLHGREALRIGSALEMAEAKRRQSDNASTLIRQWWMMENLAEQEELSGEEIRVNEEVKGIIPSSSCRMDPLFTDPEFSLDAAKALKSLRMVVRCRSTSNTSSTMASSDFGGALDPQAARRFGLTDRLIQRTSAALEQRLLDSFSDIYTAEGTYDFSSLKAARRPNRLNWLVLRETAEALMNFDSGRSLHKNYIELVIDTKFPELVSSEQRIVGANSGNGEEKEEFNVDATRSKLSSLFHHVCEVCTDEFKLIAHAFSPTLPSHLLEATSSSTAKSTHPSSFTETYPLQVARALLQRVISDRNYGMQAKINELLESIDQKGDSISGAKKLETFLVIHEKAAGLFSLLKEAAKHMREPSIPLFGDAKIKQSSAESMMPYDSNTQIVASLTQFLTSQEKSLSSGQRRGYFNLELRLLHHDCCVNLDRNGGKLTTPTKPKEDGLRVITGFAGLADYRAPIAALDKKYIKEQGFHALLNGPLKQSVSRQPLVHATNALARARLMFGTGTGGGDLVDSTARVVITIFTQMCNYYGQSYLYPILESLSEMIILNPPSTPPTLPFDEIARPHDLGVDGKFWVSIERIHSAAKSFERELWAENRNGSMRVWEILVQTRSQTSLTLAKERRIRFFQELEEIGEAVILRALDALTAHFQWILASGDGTTAGNRLFAGSGGGPYAVPSGSQLDSTNSPAAKALAFCLRSQFVHIQSALTPQSLSKFWTALSKRLFDIVVVRLLQNYTVSTVGAVVLSRDIEGLRSVSMLAGTDHSHWDILRELLTLYMTPPDSLRAMLVGAEGDINSGQGLFDRVGRDQSIVFMSRRSDYRYRTNQGMKKSIWVLELLEDLNIQHDPTDSRLNISLYCAENISDTN